MGVGVTVGVGVAVGLGVGVAVGVGDAVGVGVTAPLLDDPPPPHATSPTDKLRVISGTLQKESTLLHIAYSGAIRLTD